MNAQGDTQLILEAVSQNLGQNASSPATKADQCAV